MKKIILLCLTLISITATAQVKVGSNPTTLSTTSNLEVEAANGGKVTITKDSAKVIIKDGTQGKDRILISDANGKASWKEPNDANIAQLVIRAYNPNTLQPVGQLYYSNVPLINGESGNYNASDGAYTVTTAGFYEYNLSFEVQGPIGETFTASTSIWISDGPIRGSSVMWNPRVVSGVKWFEPGEKIEFFFSRSGPTTFNSSWKIRRIGVVIFKR